MAITVFGDTPAKVVHPNDSQSVNPRTLLVKFLSYAEARAWQKRFTEAQSMPTIEERDAAYLNVLSEVVVGLKNTPNDAAFTPAAILENWTIPEIMDFKYEIPAQMTLSPEDRRK